MKVRKTPNKRFMLMLYGDLKSKWEFADVLIYIAGNRKVWMFLPYGRKILSTYCVCPSRIDALEFVGLHPAGEINRRTFNTLRYLSARVAPEVIFEYPPPRFS